MVEMLSYIFGSLERHEVAIKNINKNLVQQNKFNRSVAVFAVVVAIDMVVTKGVIDEQRKQIKKLNDEIYILKESIESES